MNVYIHSIRSPVRDLKLCSAAHPQVAGPALPHSPGPTAAVASAGPVPL